MCQTAINMSILESLHKITFRLFAQEKKIQWISSLSWLFPLWYLVIDSKYSKIWIILKPENIKASQTSQLKTR